jgi:hypothetical protein
MRRSAKKRNTLGRFLLWSVLIAIIGIAALALYGYTWIQGYLKSDAFRAQLAMQLGRAANADATIDSLTWSGPDVHVTGATLTPKGAQAWKAISADGIQGTLDFGAARDGVWRMNRLSADTLRMDMRGLADMPKNLPLQFEEPVRSGVPQWLRRWMPTRTQIDEVQVQTFDLVPPPGQVGVAATGLSVVGNPANDTGAWHLRGQGGKLSIPGLSEPLRITRLNARLDDRALVFHDALGRWLGDSEVTARGDLPFDKTKPWNFTGSVMGLDLRQVLSADWMSRLSGVLEGDYVATAASLKARIRWKNGIVQNMSTLENVAKHTRVDRFRRIVLDVASADIERAGAITRVSNLNLQSAGLIRVEGGFVIQDGQINGDLLVGVAPDTLNWIPGSEGRVFTDRRNDAPGYVWTTVHISGPVSAPLEDLTYRVLVAMGLEEAGKALKLVEILTGTTGVGGTAADAAKGVLDTGKDVIKGSGDAAGKAVETGLDILKGMVPLLGK